MIAATFQLCSESHSVSWPVLCQLLQNLAPFETIGHVDLPLSGSVAHLLGSQLRERSQSTQI